MDLVEYGEKINEILRELSEKAVTEGSWYEACQRALITAQLMAEWAARITITTAWIATKDPSLRHINPETFLEPKVRKLCGKMHDLMFECGRKISGDGSES